ncbi:tRNA cyclic N6-threonylcarbamoyladenosine(37) synthase TcdA [Aliidiomarina minuta]|uniref:tRNA threonylcarbamoyladenosine dehydratase n=1 Tax=Aliidiomarina minuta TaxID=880057 RepID=A0A432W8R3_9GAMM|nr:tRNA cyclic N6-threonylcarbamoyladenosine(37) synthase TcdA [Aliidiomarina minuta]RUO26459.1 tRNA cyclic N6-threonylcarbamoyladenosine(37) synthase TcdA [Aliidiomarina minuta]
MDNYGQRFSGIQRLYGHTNAQRIRELHLAVVGVGGVGSWAAEALARTGVGELTLIDMDDVCLSNVNRQSHALSETVGQPKIAVLAARLQSINPELKINQVDDFVSPSNLAECFTNRPDGVLDAIDSISAKTALLAWCKRQKIRVVTTGGAGGQIDPSQIAVADIARVIQDPLMAKVRSQLRRDYNFSSNPKRKFGIDCVYSTEQLRYPATEGQVSHAKPAHGAARLDCSTGFGACMMVTGAFGMQAAATLINRLLPEPKPTA